MYISLDIIEDFTNLQSQTFAIPKNGSCYTFYVCYAFITAFNKSKILISIEIELVSSNFYHYEMECFSFDAGYEPFPRS